MYASSQPSTTRTPFARRPRQYVSQRSPNVAIVASRNASPGEDVAGFSTTSRLRYRSRARSARLVGGGTSCDANQPRSTLRHTSPWSIGVTCESGLEKSGSSAESSGERYSSSRSPSSARERMLSSIPKMTSPCGSPAVSSALLSVSFASPPWRIRSWRPVSFSNARLTSFETAKESCVTSTTSFGCAAAPAATGARASRGRRSGEPPRRERPCAETVAVPHGARLAPRRTDREEDAVGRASRGPRPAVKTFDTPRVEPGASVSPASGYSSPEVVTPSAAPPSGSSVTSSPGVPWSVRRAAHDVDERVADQRVQLERRVALRAEQEERRCEVIEAAARARDHEDAACSERERLRRGPARGRWRPSRRDAGRSACRPTRPWRARPRRPSRGRRRGRRPRGRARQRARGRRRRR